MSKIFHFGWHKPGNAGDTVLFKATQDLFNKVLAPQAWENIELSCPTDEKLIRRINSEAKFVLVGGGGLFLRDTNENNNSGWQWNINKSLLMKIKVPVILFGIGYNRFRRQPEFDPIFREHLSLCARLPGFIGLRNTGSIKKILEYLPCHLRDNLFFQPCPTTLLSKLYQIRQPRKYYKTLAVNIAFDRVNLRYGNQFSVVIPRIVAAIKQLQGRGWKIYVACHCGHDSRIISYLQDAKVDFTTEWLDGRCAKYILDFYKKITLTLGMRGHSQMIPFGCRRLFFSIITHDKLGYFLEDIGLRRLGVEIFNNDLTWRIVTGVENAYNMKSQIFQQIEAKQEEFLNISRWNMEKVLDLLD